jgi:GrpB-like predicted nucleotidyltransferase (UPF0157 family)
VSGVPPAEDQDSVGQDWEERLRQAWVEEPPKLDGRVQLAEYDPGWPGQYEGQATRIRSALGDRIMLLEHIGSTSVPGLAAKPVIDILLVVADPADEQAYVPPLERVGYRLVIREPDWYQHRLLNDAESRVNLHVHPPQSPEIARNLRFRDRLRAGRADRELYESTKRRLAARDWTYMQQYADAKGEVVEKIMRRAGPENPGDPRQTGDPV